MSVPDEQTESSQAPAQGLARSASVLAIGSLASRVLGLLREIVIAALFGATGQVSAFRVAAQVPTLLYDFLVGGMLSAALVPVLSDYARRSRRDFVQVVGALLSVFAIVLTGLVIALEVAAPGLALLLAGGFRDADPALLTLTTQLIRWLAPVVWFLSLAGVLMAVLYALQRFTFPAIATAVFNLGIVLAAPLLAPVIGIFSLAVGLLFGSLAQLTLMAVDVRRAGVPFALNFQWRHPALRRILWLYLPIAAGLVVSLFQVGLDRRLASGTGAQSIAWMANATTLQQMPLGLISVAISLAALPRLSQFYAAGDERAYRQTLGRGLRMVWMLILPAGVLLWLLGAPVTQLLFRTRRLHRGGHGAGRAGAEHLPARHDLRRRRFSAQFCLLRPLQHLAAGAGRRHQRGYLRGGGVGVGAAAWLSRVGVGGHGQASRSRCDHGAAALARSGTAARGHADGLRRDRAGGRRHGGGDLRMRRRCWQGVCPTVHRRAGAGRAGQRRGIMVYAAILMAFRLSEAQALAGAIRAGARLGQADGQ